MTKESTPPPTTESTTANTTHQPPSLPASPIAKRTKPNTDAAESTPTTTADMTVPPTAQRLPPLLVKKLTESARAPTRGSAFAAGYDLYSAKQTVIPAKGKAMVDTGLSVAVPEGTCMLSLHSIIPLCLVWVQAG